MLRQPVIRGLLRKASAPSFGRVQGFHRDRGALRRIYRLAGWRVKRELKLPPYPYIAEFG